MIQHRGLDPTTEAELQQIAALWAGDHLNTWDIGKALGVSEPEVQRLLNLAWLRGQLRGQQ